MVGLLEGWFIWCFVVLFCFVFCGLFVWVFLLCLFGFVLVVGWPFISLVG